MRIKSQRDFASGLLYVAGGLGFALIASTYRMGTPARMGPGYFPFWLGMLLALVGAIILVNAMRSERAEDKLDRWDVKGVVMVLASVVLFGVLLEAAGLVVSVVAAVIGSSLAGRDFTWRSALVNALVLVVISVVVFTYGLGLQLPVWPQFING